MKFMSVDFYLLPRTLVGSDSENARALLEVEERHFGEAPAGLDPATESRKRKLADLLLRMKPVFREFSIRFDEIAEFENITVEEARRKYRYIEINGPGIQFTIFDRYIRVSVYWGTGAEELDAIFAALSAEGEFVVFDPQAERIIDLREESLA
jgi:hypothetical protein